MATSVSDATEDSGFHIGENLSLGEQSYNDPGLPAFNNAFFLFRNLPDLTGMTISAAKLSLYQDFARQGGIEGDVYIAATGETWDEASSAATMVTVASSLGSAATTHDSSTTGWHDIDLTDAIVAIYTADPTPAAVTVMLDGFGATATYVEVIAHLGDTSANQDPGAGYHRRDEANYPRLSITYSEEAPTGSSWYQRLISS